MRYCKYAWARVGVAHLACDEVGEQPACRHDYVAFGGTSRIGSEQRHADGVLVAAAVLVLIANHDRAATSQRNRGHRVTVEEARHFRSEVGVAILGVTSQAAASAAAPAAATKSLSTFQWFHTLRCSPAGRWSTLLGWPS
jgi:hypothetical protein